MPTDPERLKLIDKLIEETVTHLEDVRRNPSKPLDTALLANFDVYLVQAIATNTRRHLVEEIALLLQTIRQDPTPVTRVVSELVKDPAKFSFTDVLQLQPEVDFVAGLQSPSIPINTITLDLLKKATETSSDAEIVAAQPAIVSALVTSFLCTPDTRVSETARKVLEQLLSTDGTAPEIAEQKTPEEFNQSMKPAIPRLVYRRVYQDKDIYELFFAYTSLGNAGKPGFVSERATSIAQARLLDFIGHGDGIFRQSQIPAVEEKYGMKNGSLLEYATTRMIDVKNDVLMHVTLLDYFSTFIEQRNGDMASSSGVASTTENLEFMIRHGLHKHTLSYYLEPEKHDSFEISLLRSGAAKYAATYAANYRTHLLQQDTATCEAILDHLTKALDKSSTYTSAQDRAQDLFVLASMPPQVLLPRPTRDSVLYAIPISSRSAAVYKTLAAIFRGPETTVNKKRGDLQISPQALDRDMIDSERAAARALYFLYTEKEPTFWKTVVTVADTVALKDAALAAIELLQSIVNSNWVPLARATVANSASQTRTRTTTDLYSLPTEEQLQSQIRLQPHRPLPPTGLHALLSAPASGHILPYLIAPPPQSHNQVGGGRGDPDSAIYTLTVAKFALLEAVVVRLKKMLRDGTTGGGEGESGDESDERRRAEIDGRSVEDYIRLLASRLVQGPFRSDVQPGSRVAVLDM